MIQVNGGAKKQGMEEVPEVHFEGVKSSTTFSSSSLYFYSHRITSSRD